MNPNLKVTSEEPESGPPGQRIEECSVRMTSALNDLMRTGNVFLGRSRFALVTV